MNCWTSHVQCKVHGRLVQLMDAAGPGGAVDEGLAIATMDHFASAVPAAEQRTKVLDKFLAARPRSERRRSRCVSGWRDPVDEFREPAHGRRTRARLLNLIDDLEYRVYSNMGPAILRHCPRGGFVFARGACRQPSQRCPVPGHPSSARSSKSNRPRRARIALQMATERPSGLPGYPEKIAQGWEMMRAQRTAFVKVFVPADWCWRPPRPRRGSARTSGTTGLPARRTSRAGGAGRRRGPL